MALSSAEEIKLGNGNDWNVSVNDRRVLIQCKNDDGSDWTILSSSVLNGGLQRVSTNDTSDLQLLNVKVPADYDGVTPNPVKLLQEIVHREGQQQSTKVDGNVGAGNIATTTTIGMMTAASMNSLRIATQQARVRQSSERKKQHVVVDAIVTAGISNTRAAGATADFFSFAAEENEAIESSSSSPMNPKPPGTINTIIVTNAILDCEDDDGSSNGNPTNVAPLVEAYAVAIEAKCRAATELGLACQKRPDQWAQGTGTDCTMIVCRRRNKSVTKRNDNDSAAETEYPRVQYPGKHTLFGELIGQAVYQATTEAILSNIEYVYGNKSGNILTKIVPLSPLTLCRLHSYKLSLLHALRHGHRPRVPSAPMKPVPKPQGMVLLVGIIGVMLSFSIHCQWGSDTVIESDISQRIRRASTEYLRPSLSILLAVVSWDRFLGGSLFVPISLHPVVLTGNTITVILKWLPEQVFRHEHPFLGMIAGCALLLGTLMISVTVAWCLLILPTVVLDESGTSGPIGAFSAKFLPWLFELYLVQSALSLQLLCTIALRMAHFLERGQIEEARDQLSWLCSRDPSNLQSDELSAGSLESLSENLSDSLVSPLTYYVLLGPLGAFGFRVANTLDSRVGYRHGRYEYVGKPSARFDDVLNLFPARVTAALLSLAMWFLDSRPGGDTTSKTSSCRGLQVAWRDAIQCSSPNAGWPMATMAGVLDVRLEKKGEYTLNKAGAPAGHKTIRIGHDIAQLAGLLAVLLALVCSSLFYEVWGSSFRW